MSNLFHASYEILDVGLTLESDSEEMLALFHRDYQWFETDFITDLRPLPVSVELNSPQRSARIGPKVFSMEGHPSPLTYVYQLILRALIEETKDFFLLHAGVVARGDQAVIIAGSPGVGKTTLVCRLLQNGFNFFSDDYCPIHKKSGKVYPFPRSVWISSQNHPFPTGSSFQSNHGFRRKKSPINPGKLPSKVADRPCEPKCLICLDPGLHSSPTCELEIGFKQEREKDFLDEIHSLSKITVERLSPEFSNWRIQYPLGEGLTKKISGLLEKYQEHIWIAYRLDRIHPDFSKEPNLTQIPVHKAAYFLLREMKHKKLLGSEEKASAELPGRFFMQLNELLDKIPSYRLQVGRLESMITLIESLVD